MSSHDYLEGVHAPLYQQPDHDELSDQMTAVLDTAQHAVETGMKTLIQYSPHRALQVFLCVARTMADAKVN